jgi:hypothetical protein
MESLQLRLSRIGTSSLGKAFLVQRCSARAFGIFFTFQMKLSNVIEETLPDMPTR